jgi:transposase
MNFKRKQCLNLIDVIAAGEIKQVMLAHQDRLARLGYALLVRLCQTHHCQQNRKLALSFSDAALGRLLTLLTNKVTRTGGTVITVDRWFPSSQICHRCGWRWHDITLADRIFVCQNSHCRYEGDRDHNASINILNEALRLVGLLDQTGAGSGYDGTINSPADLR